MFLVDWFYGILASLGEHQFAPYSTVLRGGVDQRGAELLFVTPPRERETWTANLLLSSAVHSVVPNSQPLGGDWSDL